MVSDVRNKVSEIVNSRSNKIIELVFNNLVDRPHMLYRNETVSEYIKLSKLRANFKTTDPEFIKLSYEMNYLMMVVEEMDEDLGGPYF